MTTRSPDFRSCEKKFRYGPAFPPGLDRIRTSAKAAPAAISDIATENTRRRIETIL
jgi:hypothetical protein